MFICYSRGVLCLLTAARRFSFALEVALPRIAHSIIRIPPSQRIGLFWCSCSLNRRRFRVYVSFRALSLPFDKRNVGWDWLVARITLVRLGSFGKLEFPFSDTSELGLFNHTFT